MQAQLIEGPDDHHWVLLGHRVTQMVIDAGAVRLQTWSLDASAEVRLGAPFTLRLASGAARTLDPEATESLAPALALLRRPLRSLTMTRGGELTVEFGDGAVVTARPHPRLDAWEVQGAGALEGMSYRCGAGGGVPWG